MQDKVFIAGVIGWKKVNAEKMELIPNTVNLHKTGLFLRAGWEVAGLLRAVDS